MKEIDEEKLDVLQNIEFGIVEVYRADKSLLDFDVKDAMDALVRHYHTEEEQRRPPVMRLGDRAQGYFLPSSRFASGVWEEPRPLTAPEFPKGSCRLPNLWSACEKSRSRSLSGPNKVGVKAISILSAHI